LNSVAEGGRREVRRGEGDCLTNLFNWRTNKPIDIPLEEGPGQDEDQENELKDSLEIAGTTTKVNNEITTETERDRQRDNTSKGERDSREGVMTPPNVLKKGFVWSLLECPPSPGQV
jgi:hypothetical protein